MPPPMEQGIAPVGVSQVYWKIGWGMPARKHGGIFRPNVLSYHDLLFTTLAKKRHLLSERLHRCERVAAQKFCTTAPKQDVGAGIEVIPDPTGIRIRVQSSLDDQVVVPGVVRTPCRSGRASAGRYVSGSRQLE